MWGFAPLCLLPAGSFEPQHSWDASNLLQTAAASVLSRLGKEYVAETDVDTEPRIISTWHSAHSFVHSDTESAILTIDNSVDALGNDADFEESVTVDGRFRELVEEASGDMSSGEMGTGDLPSSPPMSPPTPGSPPPLSPSPLAPVSPPPSSPTSPPPSSPTSPPPLLPGQKTAAVTKTVITVTIQIAGDISDFTEEEQAAFKAGLREELCPTLDVNGNRCPGVEIVLILTGGSVSVTAKISYNQDDSSIANASAVEQRAASLATANITKLTAQLGQQVEATPLVTVENDVPFTVTVPAPSLPPPLPRPPPPLDPPASPGNGSSGLETWIIAVIVVVGVMVLCLLPIAVCCFVYKNKRRNLTDDDGKMYIPLTVASGTTQHV